jgi:hypothetical protein
MIYQMNTMINIIKQNNFGNQVINVYNKLNDKYVELRDIMLSYILFKPLKFGMKKVISNLNDNNFKNFMLTPKTNIKLNSNQDINKFLDGLLDDNKNN